jgi:hypothetical protein
MTTPPSRLLGKLPDSGLIELRAIDGRIEECVTPLQAVALAIRGVVEGVGPRSGRVRYLRRLSEDAIQPAPELAETDATWTGRSSAIAQTNMGVYRQEVESSQMDPYGIPTRVVIGRVYTFCALRGM